MSKDAFYFSHDSNARNDVKIIKLRRELEAEGYGIFWMLIESLREQSQHKLSLSALPDLAYDFRVSQDKLEAVVKSYSLFEVDEQNNFYSKRLLRSMEALEEKRRKLSEAGKKGNDKKREKLEGTLSDSHDGATRTPPVREPYALNESNQSRENENKKNESIDTIPPSLSDVFKFFKEKRSDTKWSVEKCEKEAQNLISWYSSKDWKVGNNIMTSWPAAAEKWINIDDGRNYGKNNTIPAPPAIGQSQVSGPSKEPSPERKLEIARGCVVIAFNEFNKKGFYEDAGNAVYNAMSRDLKFDLFLSFIEGKGDQFTDKGAAKYRSGGNETNIKNGILQVLENNRLNGVHPEEKHIIEGKKIAVVEFFTQLQELETAIEDIL